MQRASIIAKILLRNRTFKMATPKFNFCDYYKNKDEALIHPTYTSKYFKVSSSVILQYLEDKKLEYRNSGKYVQLRYCPFCPKHHIENPTNQWVFGISLENGSYNCFRASCQAKGSWFDLKNYMNGTLDKDNIQKNTQQPHQKLNIFEFHTYFERLKLKEPKESYNYLIGQDWEENQRGIKDEVLKKYLIGIDIAEVYDQQEGKYIEAPLIYFPMFRYRTTHERNRLQQKALKQKKEQLLDETFTEEYKKQMKQQLDNQFDNFSYELVSCKIRAASSQLKHIQKVEPTNAAKGIFGLHLLKPDSTQIIITEGEFDAMAAYQMTGIPAISLPYGINHVPAHLVEWLDQFEKLNDIIIWVDDDNPGRLNSSKIARKLGNARTRIVQPSLQDPNDFPKDANDCLRYYQDRVMSYIDQSKCLLKKNITQFSDFKQLTKNRLLNFEQSKGTPSKTFQTFNNTTKGLRAGEFTILTGPTGSGKTTFLSQLSLEFCREGVTTLWGSFEIKTDRLAEHQLLQAYKTDVIKQKDLIDTAIKKFETEIPIYYMNFYGATDLDQVIDTIEYAIYEYNVSHVCIDNLQFMMGTQVGGNRKFDFQDEIIEKFRKLTTNNDVHLTLVIHPRKVEETEDLTIASIFGSAKATQEADNVFIIQNRPRYRVFEVKKNRYDGEIGRIGLGFDSSIKSFFELNSQEVKELNDEKSTILDIISKRKKDGKHFKQEITIVDKGGDEGDQGGNQNGNQGNGNYNSSPSTLQNDQENKVNVQNAENIIFDDQIDDNQIEHFEQLAAQYSQSENQNIQKIEIKKQDTPQESIVKQEEIKNTEIKIDITSQQKECQKLIEPSNDYLDVWKFDCDCNYGLNLKQIVSDFEANNFEQINQNQQTFFKKNDFSLKDPLDQSAQNDFDSLDPIEQKDEFEPIDDQIEFTLPQSKIKSVKKTSFIHVGKKGFKQDFSHDI